MNRSTDGHLENARTPTAAPITELLSFNVRRLANLLSSSAELRYRREFDVSLPEWRTLALLGQFQPMTVNRLARLAALDKAQMSRVVAGLIERGFIDKKPGPRRSSQLTLTTPGFDLYSALIEAANERDRALLSALDPEEREVFDRAIDKISDAAILMDHKERELP
ncbi:MarR family winged helix-turn-helix transcriptional regulator [Aeromicrobium sp. CTD01-1L150]|uniref:MarR family winged helix-turn-helix transcriptional regulator n=1 Tax=Aeromicrobium sp. CTD01-1L150 TaxID=3341830 RepID=UPI0035BFC3DC